MVEGVVLDVGLASLHLVAEVALEAGTRRCRWTRAHPRLLLACKVRSIEFFNDFLNTVVPEFRALGTSTA